MESINIEKIIDEIISGMSLREAGKKYQIDRESLKDKCMEYFKTNPEKLASFEQAIRNNKANSTAISIPDETLKSICIDLCDKKDNLRAIATRMKVDEDTLREKLFQFLSKPEHLVLARKYIAYQATLHPDYSYIKGPILVESGMYKRKMQYERAKKNIELANNIQGTEKDKADALGISVSTLRRNRLFVEKYEKEQEISDDKQK